MNVDRIVSTNIEIERKMREMHMHSELWANKYVASGEIDKQSYERMMHFKTLERHYQTQLDKRHEKDKHKKLQNLCQDINNLTKEYLNRCTFFSTNSSRTQSVKRLLDYSNQVQQKESPVDEKFTHIASFLLKELNDTEQSHNNNFFSKKFTKSRLANAYMRIFEEQGVNPNSHVLIKHANNFESNEPVVNCLVPIKFL